MLSSRIIYLACSCKTWQSQLLLEEKSKKLELMFWPVSLAYKIIINSSFNVFSVSNSQQPGMKWSYSISHTRGKPAWPHHTWLRTPSSLPTKKTDVIIPAASLRPFSEQFLWSRSRRSFKALMWLLTPTKTHPPTTPYGNSWENTDHPYHLLCKFLLISFLDQIKVALSLGPFSVLHIQH